MGFDYIPRLMAEAQTEGHTDSTALSDAATDRFLSFTIELCLRRGAPPEVGGSM